MCADKLTESKGITHNNDRVAERPSLGVREFFRSAEAIFRLAHKSDKDEFMLYLKLVALGILVVGFIGFIIKLVGNIFFG